MSSAVDIQIVSQPNLAKIESFFKDSSYRETIEFSANFNTRLCVERRLRLPFLDPQTGVAQNHSHLFIDRRHRMPGFRQGQIYTYPAARWRKSRRQYLKMCRFPDRPFQALRKEHEALIANSSLSMSTQPATGTASPSLGTVHHDNDLLNGTFLEESSSLGAAGGDTSDSKDSQQQQSTQTQQHLKEDLSKEWFYDDMDMNDVDSLDEPKSPADDEYDYDPRYGTKKRRKRRAGKRATFIPGEGNSRRRSGGGRGRSSAISNADTSYAGLDATDGVAADGSLTPTTSTGRRPRGTGTRGRRRTKAANTSDSMILIQNTTEPPSFESAAAAVGVANDNASAEEHADLRNYRKYL